MRQRERGVTTAEFGLVLAFLLVAGAIAWQFASLGLTALKVNLAAQQAAYTAASTLVIHGDQPPCWGVNGGLKDPARYGDPEVCRAITASLGDLDPARASVSVARNTTTKAPALEITISYRTPVDSPLLRLFFGPTYVITGHASSWSH